MPEEPELADASSLGDEILADARKRAERLVRRAKQDAEKLLGEARDAAEALAREIEERAEQDAANRARVTLASLPLERRRLQLTCRDDAVRAIFEDALSAARARSGDAAEKAGRAETMARLALQAAGQMPRTKLLFRAAAEDQSLIDDAFLQGLNERAPEGATFVLGEPLGGADGGVLIETGDGRQLFDNTLGARLGRCRAALRAEIAASLWGPGASSDEAQGSEDD